MNTKKYYLIYQVTNNVNGKIYIGKHETNRLDDDYMGSGKILKRAQDKYGIENFTFRVLIYLHNREEMCLLERMVVSKEFCERTDTYNINVGGEGGFQYINSSSLIKSKANKTKWSKLSEEQRKEIGRKSSNARNNDYTHTKEFSKKVSEGLKRAYRDNPDKHCHSGKPMTSETKQKLSLIMRTERNIMSRSIWIYNEKTLQRKIWPKNENIPEGWVRGGVKHRKIDETHPAHLRCWINDGSKSKFVLKSEVNKFIENGWKLGRLSFTS